jgi:hypothetical protein
MEQELLTLSEHLRSSPVFSMVRDAPSLVFVYHDLFFCHFLFGHGIVCPLIYASDPLVSTF